MKILVTLFYSNEVEVWEDVDDGIVLDGFLRIIPENPLEAGVATLAIYAPGSWRKVVYSNDD